MNRFLNLEDRRIATKNLIENEMQLLKDKGYNSIASKFIIPIEREIESTTHFITALNKAYNKLKLEKSTMEDIKSSIKYFDKERKLMII